MNNIHNTVGTQNSLPSKKEQSFDVMDTITYWNAGISFFMFTKCFFFFQCWPFSHFELRGIFLGWGALGLTCQIDSFARTICSRSTRAKRLPCHRSDGTAVCRLALTVSSLRHAFLFSSLNVLCHSPLCAIIPECLYLLFADGAIQRWWPLDILLFSVLSHRHGWADKVKCFYAFDRRGARL